MQNGKDGTIKFIKENHNPRTDPRFFWITRNRTNTSANARDKNPEDISSTKTTELDKGSNLRSLTMFHSDTNKYYPNGELMDAMSIFIKVKDLTKFKEQYINTGANQLMSEINLGDCFLCTGRFKEASIDELGKDKNIIYYQVATPIYPANR